jgi:hypothetical protein
VPLSISNSNDRIPAVPWKKIWATALLLGLSLLVAWEGFWRSQGFVPSLTDDAGLWGQTRRRVKAKDKNAVVLIGASRIQLGLHIETFSQITGVRPIQLAISGEPPIMLLQHFSRDPSFQGILISDMNEEWVWTEAEAEGRTPTKWIEAYEAQVWSAGVEQRLRILTQGAFVFRLPDIAPRHVWQTLRAGRWPTPSYLTTLPDRSVLADYTKFDVATFRRQKDETYKNMSRTPPCTPEEYRERSRKVGELVTPILQRGGKVIFIRFPTSGSLWEMEKERYPRHEFWDVFAAESRAVAIHFMDYPSLAQFECPDGAHLDYRDAIPFTKALAEILAPVLRSSGRPTAKD